ncbi:hypothetical protein [Pseudomonas vancouverensis]|uniref:Uncharacterized protein n=1 Tax=Pseudomonas vancouverensis TaxID=95300 RepID=A0A1H2MDD9_PSEVA|nr:hypothetical protein [Pseudomonas vancouverensis]KAB0499118.1 hypothetical protein F7R09_07385 [Pseudomonas vancouverensis]TDB57814.1 hypothetical protein EIY72_26555 [Pseudomonas vancouverensis]SDU91209.1 hypothetical protein SAMN05216558_0594 [Pseudomonas vancouverensis]
MNWIEQVEDELEFQVWRSTQQACSAAAFVRLIEAALDSYNRVPRYDWPTRLHVKQYCAINQVSFQA